MTALSSPYARAVLYRLQGKHIYAETVPAKEKAHRRRVNKLARIARRKAN